MSNSTQLRIVGTAVCRFGSALGTHDAGDADAMRANRLNDDSLFCVFCGRRGPSTFEALVNAAGENKGRIVRNDSRLDHRFTVTISPNAWASVVYDKREQFDIDQPGQDFGEEYTSPAPEAKLPVEIDNACKALTKLGYRQTGSHASNTMGTIIMVLGNRLFPGDPDRGAVDGVRVELSWLY